VLPVGLLKLSGTIRQQEKSTNHFYRGSNIQQQGVRYSKRYRDLSLQLQYFSIGDDDSAVQDVVPIHDALATGLVMSREKEGQAGSSEQYPHFRVAEKDTGHIPATQSKQMKLSCSSRLASFLSKKHKVQSSVPVMVTQKSCTKSGAKSW